MRRTFQIPNLYLVRAPWIYPTDDTPEGAAVPLLKQLTFPVASYACAGDDEGRPQDGTKSGLWKVQLGPKGLRQLGQDSRFQILRPIVEYPPAIAMATVTTLIDDTFTDTNGTVITAHSHDTNTPGNAWVDYEGDNDIQSNQLQANSASVSTAAIDAGVTDAIVAVSTHLPDLTAGLVGRLSDANNYWLGRWDNNSGSKELEMFDKVAGSFTQRVVKTSTASTDNTIGQKLLLIGTQIWFADTTNGLAIYFSSSTHAANTSFGVRSNYTSNKAEYDNFTVEEIEDNAGGGGGGGRQGLHAIESGAV